MQHITYHRNLLLVVAATVHDDGSITFSKVRWSRASARRSLLRQVTVRSVRGDFHR